MVVLMKLDKIKELWINVSDMTVNDMAMATASLNYNIDRIEKDSDNVYFVFSRSAINKAIFGIDWVD